MITPSNTPDTGFEAVSEKSHLNLEGMQAECSNYGLGGFSKRELNSQAWRNYVSPAHMA